MNRIVNQYDGSDYHLFYADGRDSPDMDVAGTGKIAWAGWILWWTSTEPMRIAIFTKAACPSIASERTPHADQQKSHTSLQRGSSGQFKPSLDFRPQEGPLGEIPAGVRRWLCRDPPPLIAATPPTLAALVLAWVRRRGAPSDEDQA